MRRTALALALLFCALNPGAASAAQARQPVVVELFTAQGCSSCVGAGKTVDELADRSGVLALTLAVDYWNYLGWADTFAKPEFTARQKAYMRKLAIGEVYTPEVIVDGRAEAAGADQKKIETLIRQARRAKTAGPQVRLLHRSRAQVGPGPSPAGGADVWLVRYDPGVQDVTVDKGENRGRTLSQRNVVRQLVRLGRWRGKAKTYVLPSAPSGRSLKTVVLVQGADGGRILAVAQR
jgi:hypothetical protein